MMMVTVIWGNRNQWPSFSQLCSVQFQSFFWSMQLNLQTLAATPFSEPMLLSPRQTYTPNPTPNLHPLDHLPFTLTLSPWDFTLSSHFLH